jgi:magnesium transporter
VGVGPENLARDIVTLLHSEDRDELLGILSAAAREGRLSDTLASLSTRDIHKLADTLGDNDFADVLGEMDPPDAAQLLTRLAVRDAADVLEAMDPDDAADVVGAFDEDDANRFLIEMEPVEAAELRQLLSYPPDTAGGRMTPAFIAISADLRADQAVVALRQLSREAETIYYVYVTDNDGQLSGVLSLRGLVLSPPETQVQDVMVTDVVTVTVDTDQEIAAQTLTDHNLLALPVVDDHGRLQGIITSDDVSDIIEQETTEDIERLGGSAPLEEPYLRARPVHLVKKRLGWLLVLFLAQAYTGTVLAFYEDTLEAVTALVFFMPLLIGTGGNAGSQVVTTIVRAMGVGDVVFRDIFRILWKEMQTGLLLGIAMAVAVFARALMLGVGVDIGIVVGVTILAIVIWAVTVGAILPLVLRQLRVDPAVVSAPFIATLVDGTGLLIYFTVAGIVLGLN